MWMGGTIPPIEMLHRPDGATIAELVSPLGGSFNPRCHVQRAQEESHKVEDRGHIYRIPA
jgi:hypothetical protein